MEDPKQSSSVTLQPDQLVIETKGPNSPVSQHPHEEDVQLEVDVPSVDNYRLYKRRWIGLGASPLPKRFLRADASAQSQWLC